MPYTPKTNGKPWETMVSFLRYGGYKVETAGRVERMGSLGGYDSIDSVNEHRDMESFKKSDARVFSAIKIALQAVGELKKQELSAANGELIRSYKQQFLGAEVQVA